MPVETNTKIYNIENVLFFQIYSTKVSPDHYAYLYARTTMLHYVQIYERSSSWKTSLFTVLALRSEINKTLALLNTADRVHYRITVLQQTISTQFRVK